jgi:hypothetical protein
MSSDGQSIFSGVRTVLYIRELQKISIEESNSIMMGKDQNIFRADDLLKLFIKKRKWEEPML